MQRKGKIPRPSSDTEELEDDDISQPIRRVSNFVFKSVQFRGNVFKLCAIKDSLGKIELTISPDIDHGKGLVSVLYEPVFFSAQVDHFFYPSQTDSETDLLFENMVLGENRRRAEFHKDVMCIIKLVAVHLRCKLMSLYDASRYPVNNYLLALNAFKPPYASYYSKHHGFFSKAALNHIDTSNKALVLKQANSCLQSNRFLAKHTLPETVEQVVTAYFDYKKTGTIKPPRDPLNPNIIPGGLQRNLVTVLEPDQWIIFDNSTNLFAFERIPFTFSIQGDQFVVLSSYTMNAKGSSS